MNSENPNDKPKSKKNIVLWVVGIFVLLILIGVLFGEETPTTDQQSNSNDTEIETSVENDMVEEADNTEQTQQLNKEDTTYIDTEESLPAEYKSALNKANLYSNSMNMSKRGVYDQLVSEYGEKFTLEAAQYAIDNVKADWNKNALAKAKTYQDTMDISPASIKDQLISEYGEKFTESEANYAIENLNN